MSKQKQHTANYVIITLLALQVVTIGWLVMLQVTLNTRDFGSERNTQQLLNTVAELRFCLDNQIIPCNDNAIEQWNTNHPDDTFRRND